MSSYRKCLLCKEVKDKDSQFTIESWKCDVCIKAAKSGASAPSAAPPSSVAAPPAAPVTAPPANLPVATPAAPPAVAPVTQPAAQPNTQWNAPTAPPVPSPAPGWNAPGPTQPPTQWGVAPLPTAPSPSAPPAAPAAGFNAPQCSQCAQPITGPALDAMQGKWHPDCFLCCICNAAIKEVDFAIVDGKQAHEACRPKPLCWKCQTPIGGMILTALNAKWHESCFKCIKCEAPLAHQKFFIEEDDDGNEVPLCEGCTPKPEPCSNCGNPVDRGIVALDATWHPQCFVCGSCKKQLDGPFFPKGKVPYCCKECYLSAP